MNAYLLEERLGCRVEVVTTEALSPFIGPRILAEAQDAFEPRDYLRHILVEADDLLAHAADVKRDEFVANETLRRAIV